MTDQSYTYNPRPSGQSKGVHADRQHQLKRYFLASLEVDWLIDVELLLLTFSTGIQDAISFPDFQCFASNQTGNSVVMAVGLSGLGGGLFNIRTIVLSLCMFILGATFTGQVANFVGSRRRLWLLISHTVQTAMIFGAATIQFVHGVQSSGPSALGAMALLAFSSGAQVASMRPMRRPEITTAMATAAWVDLVIDPGLFKLKNPSRDRRALFLACLVGGSFAGAYMHVNIGSPEALCVSAAGKSLVTIFLLFNQPERPKELSEQAQI
jgi:uncharacterized membrane protein YoaK (UPF0700 family)